MSEGGRDPEPYRHLLGLEAPWFVSEVGWTLTYGRPLQDRQPLPVRGLELYQG